MLKDFPATEKPRERLAKYGVEALSNSELLAIILAFGTYKKNVMMLSSEILSQYDLVQMSNESIQVLSKIKGVGVAKACRICACFELGRRTASYTREKQPFISCAADVYKLLSQRYSVKRQEHLCVLFLDTRKRLIKEEILFIGTLDSSIIHPREIFNRAVQNMAASIIVAHNHPSGDPSPSQEDILITRQITEAGKIMGIPLLDHVVIGAGNYISIKEKER
jgi:DNA repair protein RadC